MTEMIVNSSWNLRERQIFDLLHLVSAELSNTLPSNFKNATLACLGSLYGRALAATLAIYNFLI